MKQSPNAHPNSRIVYIKRLPAVIHESNPDLQADYFSFASRSIGSFFAKDSTRPGTGLTISEEDLLMPHILNIPAEDRDFRQRVTDYFHGITTRVKGDADGAVFEVGLEYGGESISENGLKLTNPPLNVGQYVAYKHALAHPEVASSKAEGKGNSLKLYHAYDPDKETGIKLTASDVKDTAFQAYLELKRDPKSVTMYLTLLGVNTDSMGMDTQVLELRGIAERKPTDFVKVHNDKNKGVSYMIDQMKQYKVLRSAGTRLLIAESGDEIGRDKEQAVLYMKDQKNTKQVSILKAQLRDALKKAGKEDSVHGDAQGAKQEASPPEENLTLADIE